MEAPISAVPKRTRNRLIIGLCCAFTVGTAWFAYWVTSLPEKKIINGGLIISAEDLDFGEAWEQDEFQWTMRISNSTNNDINIKKLLTSCSCTSVEPQSLIVEASREEEVTVTIDLRLDRPQGIGKDSQQLTRPFDVSLLPELTDHTDSLSRPWRLEGRVRQSFVIEDNPIDFGDIPLEGESFSPKVVGVKCLDSIASLTATCDSEFASVRILPPEKGSEWRRLEVTPVSTLPQGRFTFDLSLQGVTDQGKTLPMVGVTVGGRVVNDVQLVPPSLTFGAARLGEVIEETVLIRSRLGKPIEIESAESDLDGITIKASGRRNGSAVYRLLVQPSKIGSHSGTVHFVVRSESQSRRISLAVNYIGFSTSSNSSANNSIETAYTKSGDR